MSKGNEVLFSVRHQAEDGEYFYAIPPTSLKRVKEYVENSQVGGEIMALGARKVAVAKVEFPAEQLRRLLESNKSNGNSPAAEQNKVPAQKQKARAVRAATPKKPGKPRANRKGRPRVSVGGAKKQSAK